MKLLVVKLSDLGDALTVTPALRSLREGLPQAQISALVPPNSAAVLKGLPTVDELLVFDKFRFDSPVQAVAPRQLAYGAGLYRRLQAERFDAIAIMHHLTTAFGAAKYAALALGSRAGRRVGLDNGRGWFLTEKVVDYGFGGRHEVEYWLEVARLLGGAPGPYPMEVALSPQDEAAADSHLGPLPAGPRLVIHAGGGGYNPRRRWPLAGFAEVGRTLHQQYQAQMVLVGGPEETLLGDELARQLDFPVVNLTGRTTIKELAAVLKAARLFIGNDAGPMHLAAAVGTPQVAIFGPTNPNAWGPWSPHGRTKVVQAELACCPCLYVGPIGGRNPACPEVACLQAITSEMVLAAARSLLES